VKKRGDEWFARTSMGWEPFIPKWAWYENLAHQILFNKILRAAIRPQIKKLKKIKIGGMCPVTGEVLTPQNIEIHHLTPFSKLAKNFLAEEGVSVEDLEITWEWAGWPYESPLLPKIELPHGLMSRFARYHGQNAGLLAVSSRGHRLIHGGKIKNKF